MSRLIKGTAGKVEFKVTHQIPCSYVTMCVEADISVVQTPTTAHELSIGVPLGRCTQTQEILCKCIFTPSLFGSVKTNSGLFVSFVWAWEKADSQTCM